jgi:uncharacterized RDD family membrane protein YckC
LNNTNTNKLKLATNRKRLLSFIIDDMFITFLTLIILWDKITSSGGRVVDIMTIIDQTYMQIIIMKVIYQTYFIWYYGATIGKTIMKLKVIDFEHFGRVSLLKSFIRACVRIVSELFVYFGFIIAYFTDSRQTLHDKVGQTLVIDA